MLYCLSRPAYCKTQVDDVPFEEKFDHMKRLMRLTHKQGVDGQFRVNEASRGNRLPIREGWSGWHPRACPIFAH